MYGSLLPTSSPENNILSDSTQQPSSSSGGVPSSSLVESQSTTTTMIHHQQQHHHPSLLKELLFSTELIFRTKLTWLLLFGPIALLGQETELLGASACFMFAGLTLIPLAERLSFVTEEVACHTSQTIGALLNATFGNAPELLISSAALREGFYRVVQLTLLGSILTNLLFVFGLSCLVGGLRYQVQDLRTVSGNASIGMLLVAVGGLALPAALMLSNEMLSISHERQYVDKNFDGISDINDGPTYSMIGFSRFNAVLMITGYLLYLLFQLGSHRDEFEDDSEDEIDEEDDGMYGEEEEGHLMQSHHAIQARKNKRRKNKFCHRLLRRMQRWGAVHNGDDDDDDEDQKILYDGLSTVEMEISPKKSRALGGSNKAAILPGHILRTRHDGGVVTPQSRLDSMNEKGNAIPMSNSSSRRRAGLLTERGDHAEIAPSDELVQHTGNRRSALNKSHCSDGSETYIFSLDMPREEESHMSFRAGLFWLFILTISISVMSDILVDTIDAFAFRMNISEVFTSLVILPYFSNIAEQVSAVLFAYRNEMDLVVGITVGSAVQIALFVLPGSVLIGWAMDRSMSLFFRGFETCCLVFAVVSVSIVLQGKTTNWLSGAYLIGVYFMIAAGFWYHELENLTVDGDLLTPHNQTILTEEANEGY